MAGPSVFLPEFADLVSVEIVDLRLVSIFGGELAIQNKIFPGGGNGYPVDGNVFERGVGVIFFPVARLKANATGSWFFVPLMATIFPSWEMFPSHGPR